MKHLATCLLVTVCIVATLKGCHGVPVRNPRQAAESDNCDHPFHSFLCNKAPRSRGGSPQPDGSAVSKVVAKPKDPPPYEPPFSGENSFLDPTFLSTSPPPPPPPTTTIRITTSRVVPPRPTPPRPTTPKPSPPLKGDSSFGDPVYARPKATTPPPSRPIEAQAAIATEVRTPPAAQDLCGHSFHSFLCQPGRRSGTRRVITGKMPPNLQGASSFPEAAKIKPTTKPPPPPPPPPSEIPDASFQSPSFYKPPLEITTRKALVTPKATTPKPRPTTPRTTPAPPQPEVPDASFDSPSFYKPPAVVTRPPPPPPPPVRTTSKPLEVAPQQVVPVRVAPPSQGHYKGQNPCDHAFHSYLCQTGSGRRKNLVPSASNLQAVARPTTTTTTTTTTEAPVVPDSSQLSGVALSPDRPKSTMRPPPPSTTTTTRRPPPPPPSTTRRPPPQPPIETAPSADQLSVFLLPSTKPPRPVFQAAADTPVSREVVPDKCKHSFHSFLCQPARPRKIQAPQQQAAPSNIDASLLLPDLRTTTTVRPTRPPPPPTTRRTTPSPPTTQEVAQFPDSSFQSPQLIQPPRPPPVKPTTTSRPPPPPPKATTSSPLSPPLEPAPSSQQNELLPASFGRGPSASNADNDLSDKCSHPFHGYLCKKAPRARRPIRIN